MHDFGALNGSDDIPAHEYRNAIRCWFAGLLRMRKAGRRRGATP
jgi:hypothetical protein